VFVCDFADDMSPVSSNRRMLRRYARQHAKQAHGGDFARR
jgi:hypothetical protein